MKIIDISVCFNTSGTISTSGYGLKFTAPADGTLTAWIGLGGSSERNIKLTTTGTDSITPTSGDLAVGTDSTSYYTPHEVVLRDQR